MTHVKWIGLISLIVLLSACGGAQSPSTQALAKAVQPTLTSNGNESLRTQPQTPIRYDIIADAQLSACIKAFGATHQEDVQILTCTDQGIRTLEGIEQFSHLRVLNLSNNHIHDLAPLGRLTSVSYITLDHNDIRDLSPLKPLQHLVRLSARFNRIDSILPLKHNSELSNLYLDHNEILSLEVMSELKPLRHISVQFNPASVPNQLPATLKTYRI